MKLVQFLCKEEQQLLQIMRSESVFLSIKKIETLLELTKMMRKCQNIYLSNLR